MPRVVAMPFAGGVIDLQAFLALSFPEHAPRIAQQFFALQASPQPGGVVDDWLQAAIETVMPDAAPDNGTSLLRYIDRAPRGAAWQSWLDRPQAKQLFVYSDFPEALIRAYLTRLGQSDAEISSPESRGDPLALGLGSSPGKPLITNDIEWLASLDGLGEPCPWLV